MQFLHKSTDSPFIELTEIVGPIVFVAQSPDNNGRVIMMLIDHISQHTAGLFLIYRTSQASAAPGNFFPDKDTQ